MANSYIALDPTMILVVLPGKSLGDQGLKVAVFALACLRLRWDEIEEESVCVCKG